MKFRVERICPFDKSEYSKALQERIGSLLPLTIRVNKKPVHPPPSGCVLKKYRVPSLEGNRIRAKLGSPQSPQDFSVCEHMGHVIE